MNISFLFGNGFDIRMGLESSYEKIEKAYCATPSSSTHIVKFKQSMLEKSKLWSDFELQMGKYTEEFSPDSIDEYTDCIRDFTYFLNDDLIEKERSIDYTQHDILIHDNFHAFLLGFHNELATTYQDIIDRKINLKSEHIVYNFISFNYTHILDICLDMAFKDNRKISTHRCSNYNYDHTVNQKVAHIHGTLDDTLIMGVDNAEQIINPLWASSSRFCERFIKPSINKRAGTQIDINVQKLINDSEIYCIFGMSLGATDATWWKMIANKLANYDRRLIIYSHDNKASQKLTMAADKFAYEDNIRDKFLEVAKVKIEERELIIPKIHVIRNTSHLNMHLVPPLSKEKIQTA